MTLSECKHQCDLFKQYAHYLAEEYEEIFKDLPEDLDFGQDVDLTETCNYIVHQKEILNKKVLELELVKK